MSRAHSYSHSRAHSPTFPSLTYVTTHSPTLPSLYLRHSSFSNPSIVSATSQLILQPFFCFSYVTWRAAHAPSQICPSNILHLSTAVFLSSVLASKYHASNMPYTLDYKVTYFGKITDFKPGEHVKFLPGRNLYLNSN